MNDPPVVLYHRIDGNGEPLLLLNGVGMSVSAWEPVARQFAERFRLVRCDFRGQLMMPVTPPADVADHAEDVIALHVADAGAATVTIANGASASTVSVDGLVVLQLDGVLDLSADDIVVTDTAAFDSGSYIVTHNTGSATSTI